MTAIQNLREGDERIDKKLDNEFDKFISKAHKADHPKNVLQRLMSKK